MISTFAETLPRSCKGSVGLLRKRVGGGSGEICSRQHALGSKSQEWKDRSQRRGDRQIQKRSGEKDFLQAEECGFYLEDH